VSLISAVYLNYLHSYYGVLVDLEGVYDDMGDMSEILELAVVKALDQDHEIDFKSVDDCYSEWLEWLDDLAVNEKPLEFDDYLEYHDYGIYLDISGYNHKYDYDCGYLGLTTFKTVSVFDYIPHNVSYVKITHLDFTDEELGVKGGSMIREFELDEVNDLIRRGMIRGLEYQFYSETDKALTVVMDLDKKTVKTLEEDIV
jgi:hypothetical protein